MQTGVGQAQSSERLSTRIAGRLLLRECGHCGGAPTIAAALRAALPLHEHRHYHMHIVIVFARIRLDDAGA